MIFTVPEMYFKAIRQNITSEHLDIKVQVVRVLFTAQRFSVCALLVTLDTSSLYFSLFRIFSAEGTFLFTLTTWLTELSVECIKGCFRRWNPSRFRSIASLHSFHIFGFIKPQHTFLLLQRCRHFLDCSDSGGISLQLHMHTLIQNFDSFNAMSGSSDVCMCTSNRIVQAVIWQTVVV
jgi:hypothetical protein